MYVSFTVSDDMVFIHSNFHLGIMPPTFKNKEGPATPRLIVSPKQVGCILCKAGTIIAGMGNLSKAHIIVLSKDMIPRSVQQSDEVFQESMNLHLLGFILMRLCFILISWDNHWMKCLLLGPQRCQRQGITWKFLILFYCVPVGWKRVATCG